MFGDTPIQISPDRSAVRFLGIWINISNKPSHVKKQVEQIITSFIKTVQHKPLTEMQLFYVINMVLYPLIIYRIQCTPLSYEEYNKLTTPFDNSSNTSLPSQYLLSIRSFIVNPF